MLEKLSNGKQSITDFVNTGPSTDSGIEGESFNERAAKSDECLTRNVTNDQADELVGESNQNENVIIF